LTFLQADIACYELGFPSGAVSALQNSYFGLVPTTFSYDDVQCVGNESTINECRHINYHNCGASEGAAVICNSTIPTGSISGANVTILTNFP
jgi:hypothetical protein